MIGEKKKNPTVFVYLYTFYLSTIIMFLELQDSVYVCMVCACAYVTVPVSSGIERSFSQGRELASSW